MSKFSDELNQLIKVRVGTVKKLTDDIGFERTLFHRVLKSERQLEYEDICRICDYLELTFEEKRTLLEYYEMDIVGEKVYNERMYIKNTIEGISKKIDIDNIIPTGALSDIELTEEFHPADFSTYNGLHKVQKFIKYMLIDISKTKNTINCFIPFELKNFYSTLHSLFRAKPDNIKLNQLLMVDRNSDSAKLVFDLISDVIVLASVASENYQAHYFYSDSKIEPEFPMFMPYYFFTDKVLVTISTDFEKAIYYTNPKILNLVKDYFQLKYDASSKFIKNAFKESGDILQTLNSVQNRLPDVRCIEPQPAFCSSKFITYENAQKVIKKDVPNREMLIEMLIKFYAEIDYKPDRKSFFTEDGLTEFAKNGVIPVFPKEFILPCTVEHRIEYLQIVRDEILNSKHTYYKLIKSSQLFFSPLLSIDISQNGGTIFSLNNKKSIITVEILSLKINDMFMNYMDWLYESDCVYSNFDTINILTRQINQLKASLEN